MDKLKHLSQSPNKTDPQWTALYNTDLRNLFPKHELAKIEKAKLRFDRFRLVMENIGEFLYLEQHRRDKGMLGRDVGDLWGEIGELEREMEAEGREYKVDVINQRQNAQLISTQATRYIQDLSTRQPPKNQIFHHSITSSPAWQKYFSLHSQKPTQISPQHQFQQKVQLAHTIQIPNSCQQLNQSTASQILWGRLRDGEIGRRLMERWGNGGAERTGAGEEVSKEFGNQWRSLIREIQFSQYV